MSELSPEMVESFGKLLAEALKTALPVVTATNSGASNSANVSQHKPPQFSMKEFNSSDGTSVEDYFKRFDWALDLSKIPATEHAKYARVHMGAELNNALKFLIAPQTPERQSYTEISKVLTEHYDTPKNKYSESVRFRHLVQNRDEAIASFSLRLRQGAAHCEYGTFLDRMLIEQFVGSRYER